MGCSSYDVINYDSNQKEDYLTKVIYESIITRKKAQIQAQYDAEQEEAERLEREYLRQQYLLNSIDNKGPKSYVDNLITTEIPKMDFGIIAPEEEIVKDLNDRDCEEYKEDEVDEEEEIDIEELKKEEEKNKNEIEELKRQIEEMNKKEEEKDVKKNKERKKRGNAGFFGKKNEDKEEEKNEEEKKEEKQEENEEKKSNQKEGSEKEKKYSQKEENEEKKSSQKEGSEKEKNSDIKKEKENNDIDGVNSKGIKSNVDSEEKSKENSNKDEANDDKNKKRKKNKKEKSRRKKEKGKDKEEKEELNNEEENDEEKKIKEEKAKKKKEKMVDRLKALMELKVEDPPYKDQIKRYKYPKKVDEHANKLDFSPTPSELVLCIIGDEKCGKSSFIKKYTRDAFDEVYQKTEKIDNYDEIEAEVDSKKIKLVILDTPPLTIRKNIKLIQEEGINKSHIIIYIFDINDEHAEFKVRLMTQSLEFNEKQIIAIIGNKSDNVSIYASKNKETIRDYCTIKNYIFEVISCSDTFKNEIEDFVNNKIIKQYLNLNKK